MSLSSPETYRRAVTRSYGEFATAILLFALGAVLGSTVPSIGTAGESLPEFTVWYFVRHNTRVLFGLWLGAPLFGLPTIFGLVLNGSVFSNALVTASIPLVERLALVFPHTLFELPGIIVAGSVGLKPVFSFVRYLREEQSRPLRAADVRDLLRLALISLALIGVAGVLEALVTPVVYGTVAA
jgi:stage II sporulation protein M